MTRLPATQRTSGDSVGLVWQKLITGPGEQDKERHIRSFLSQVKPPQSTLYGSAFHRFARRTPPGPERRVRTFQAQGRVLCGLGLPAVMENGLSLHHVYGVPFLPGSSLKGIVRAWCVEQYAGTTWGMQGDQPGPALRELLGVSAGADDEGGTSGVVSFLDALWVPQAGSRPWVVEIVTPHMIGYYTDRSYQTPPDGVESPKPNPFLAAEGRFRVVIEGPDGWVDRAMDLLTEALAERGVGAKTRAGYGRLIRTDDCDVDRAAQEAQQKRLAAARAASEAARAEAEAEATRLHLASLPDLRARLEALADLQGRPQAIDAARAWVVGEARPFGDARDAGAIAEAIRWLYAQKQAHGLIAELRKRGEGALAEAGEAALRAPEAAPARRVEPTRSGYGSNHREPSSFPSKAEFQKGKPSLDGFAKMIAAGHFDEETVRAAMAHLIAHGAKGGHLGVIKKAYGIEEE